MLSQLVTTNTGSPNKRKWRRKPKPKQNAFGKLVSLVSLKDDLALTSKIFEFSAFVLGWWAGREDFVEENLAAIVAEL